LQRLSRGDAQRRYRDIQKYREEVMRERERERERERQRIHRGGLRRRNKDDDEDAEEAE
jgi:hypothetical protein